jgi:hypothetical protein
MADCSLCSLGAANRAAIFATSAAADPDRQALSFIQSLRQQATGAVVQQVSSVVVQQEPSTAGCNLTRPRGGEDPWTISFAGLIVLP